MKFPIRIEEPCEPCVAHDAREVTIARAGLRAGHGLFLTAARAPAQLRGQLALLQPPLAQPNRPGGAAAPRAQL